jgi:hypothetical protein
MPLEAPNSQSSDREVDDSCVSRISSPFTTRLNMASGDDRYQPKDAVKAGINGTLVVGSAGLAVSAIQNTLTKRNVSAWGVFTRTGGTAAMFGTFDIFQTPI